MMSAAPAVAAMNGKQPDPNVTPQVPAQTPSPGTIDLTDTVEAVRSSFVSLGTAFLIEGASKVPYLMWLNFPIIKQIFQYSVKYFLGKLSEWTAMQAFFMNTTLRKQGQARDFIAAVAALNALPKTASKEEYANAEKARMVAFRNFVMVTN